MLAEENPDHGKQGYYLAASGNVAWDDLYAAMAKALAKRGVVEDASVTLADDAALEKMSAGIGSYCTKDLVRVMLGGE